MILSKRFFFPNRTEWCSFHKIPNFLCSRCVKRVFYSVFVWKCTDKCKHRFGVQLLQNPQLCSSTPWKFSAYSTALLRVIHRIQYENLFGSPDWNFKNYWVRLTVRVWLGIKGIVRIGLIEELTRIVCLGILIFSVNRMASLWISTVHNELHIHPNTNPTLQLTSADICKHRVILQEYRLFLAITNNCTVHMNVLSARVNKGNWKGEQKILNWIPILILPIINC